MKLKNVLSILCLLLFVGCKQEDFSKVKVLNKNFIDTKIGTIKNKKLIRHIIVKKAPLPTTKKVYIQHIILPDNLTVPQKKQRFKDILVPIITEVYIELNNKYNKIKTDIQNHTNQAEIEQLRQYYKLKPNDNLLHSLKPHPISIVLAQAAIESAWLTSRFTLKANNIFGVWSFNKNEPRIAATGLRGKKIIYLKKYNTLKDAVKDYYKNLGRNWAYRDFREQRVLHNDPYKLVEHLGSYSEEKERYIRLLKKMIKYNQFDKYDIK